MRIRTQLIAFAATSVLVTGLGAAVVFAAGRREDAASAALSRAQVAEHEVSGLLALTQEYARYGEPRAAEQWHLRHAAIAAALEEDASAVRSVPLGQLRDVTGSLPLLFARLEEMPAGDDPFTARRKETLLDQLLTNTQTMSDYAYQWFQDAVVQREAAEREFKWIALAVPCAMFLLLLASMVLVIRRVLGPMRRLELAAQAIRRGDLTQRLASGMRDEFGDLSRQFDDMTAALVASDRRRDRSEQQLREVTDNLPALVAYVDRQHVYRFANARFREWLGQDNAAMLGRHAGLAMGDQVYAAMKPMLERALAGERVAWHHTVHREGQERHLLTEYIPDIEADGAVRGCYALTVDITERRAAELETERGQRRMADLTDAIPALVGYFDLREVCHYANEAGLRTLGVNASDVPGITLREALGEQIYAQQRPYVREALQGRRARLEAKAEFVGREAHFQAHFIPDRGDGGQQRGFYLMMFDITALKEAEDRRARAEARLLAITDNLPVDISYIDADQRYRFVNRTGVDWLARSADEVLGARMGDMLAPEAYEQRREHIERAFGGERVSFEFEASIRGAQRWLQYAYIPDIEADGRVAGLYGLGTDLSAVKNVERQLSLLVRSDVLTGMANRYQFNEAMPQAFSRARRAGSGLGLMYLDIDRFKSINDSLGHAAGDEVLKAFAQRLKQSVRLTDIVARLGGDEFVILLEGLQREEEAHIVARKIIANVAAPLQLDNGRILHMTTSIGVALRRRVTTVEPAAVESLIARADAALYKAKEAGRNTYRVLADDVPMTEGAGP